MSILKIYHLDITFSSCYTVFGEVNIMSIGKNNTRMIVTIPIKLKEQLDALAEEEGRSTSNLVVKIVKEYIEQNQSRE